MQFGPTRSVLEDAPKATARNSSAEATKIEEETTSRTFDANFSIGEITAIIPTERYDATKPCFELKLGVKPRHRESGQDDGSRREDILEITKLGFARGYASDVVRDGTYETIEGEDRQERRIHGVARTNATLFRSPQEASNSPTDLSA